jgi:hypothetical protein
MDSVSVAVVASWGGIEAMRTCVDGERVHFAYKEFSSTSGLAHEAEAWRSEMLERRTALEFLSYPLTVE